VNPVRSIIAVLGGIGLASLVVEALEFTLVNAVAGGTIADMAGYFAVRNQPAVLGAKLVYNTLAAVLGGYMTAKDSSGNKCAILGVEARARRGATSAHTGRMQARSNEARRDASAFRMAHLFPDES